MALGYSPYRDTSLTREYTFACVPVYMYGYLALTEAHPPENLQ